MVPLELDGESLRLILYLKDGTNLRVTEQWSEKTLKRYNYYWLTSNNELKIGWDNAPHHTRLANFPDHKHVGGRENLIYEGQIPFILFSLPFLECHGRRSGGREPFPQQTGK